MRGRDNGNAELNIMAIAQWSIRDEGLAIIIIIISGHMGLPFNHLVFDAHSPSFNHGSNYTIQYF